MTDLPQPLVRALAGRYRLERELGAGGMATVYLATDLKLEREVAVKVLRPELAAVLGAQRFLNEIKISARLDHPHILTLIDSGQSDDFLYYVLPYVRGESLRARLDREKQLGLDEALAITRQVAAALDYAHRQGVVHRDIKPENILLQEGEAMLADFGIALAVTEAAGARLTDTGISLGTPQYMSPEQATGDRQLDARSDVYSLAAVTYEMLAGEPPHTGPTAQAVIAKLLTERPTGLRVVRDTVPVAIERAVHQALARTPADRFKRAGDFVAALTARRSAPGGGGAGFGWRRVGAGVAVGLGLAAVAFVAWRLLAPGGPSLVLGHSDQLTAAPGLEIQPAISPDGKLVAYAVGNAARMRIYLRPASGGRTIPLSDDSTAVETQPRWSPDGTQLLFLSRGGVSVAPALGGTSRPVIPPSATAAVRSAAWSPDGREIAFVRADSLLVAPAGGDATRLVALSRDTHSCDWSPDGRWIACVVLNTESVTPGASFGNLAPSAIDLFPAGGGGAAVRLVQPTAYNQSPVWLRGQADRLLFVSNREGPRDIYALDVSRDGTARGAAARLTTGLGALSISLPADDSRLAYAVYTARANIWSLPIPAHPPVTDAGATQLTSGSQVIEAMQVSWDGRWLVYDSNLRGNSDIYRIPIAGGEPEQLTNNPADEFAPDLSPDGTLLAYHSWRTGTRDIEVKPLDGGPVQHITDSPAQESYPRWSPDGRSLAYYDQVAPRTLYVVHRDAAGHWSAPTVLARPATDDAWSPDGRWIAYHASNFDVPGPLVVVSAGGGTPRLVFTPSSTAPRVARVNWSADGKTLYYKTHDAQGRTSFWGVPAAGGTPRLLVRFPDPDRQSNRADFSVDARRFYFAIEDRQSDVWVAEIERR
jgi:eukaryotic-like serine/threonine-protein kinase